MRPLRLTIQAFGPFAHQQTIDFFRLGDTPFFLINGPTGAGKSAILDAICYAMYGETTGSERAGDQMRCDFSSADVLTSVEFEFELGHDRYRVVRTPEQWVPKKRGEGQTRKAHSAYLYWWNDQQTWQPMTEKTSEVAQQLAERIGLNVKQFRQVMVIPQGKFRDLLLANSKDREQILGQLFDTQLYLDIERTLFDKAADIRKAKSEFDQQIKGSLDIAGVADEGTLAQCLTDARHEQTRQQAQLNQQRQTLEQWQTELVTQQALQQKFQQLTQLNADYQQHQLQQADIAAQEHSYKQALNADYIAKDFERRNGLRQQLEALLAKQHQQQQALNEAETHWQTSVQQYQTVEPQLLTIGEKQVTVGRYQEALSQYQALTERQRTEANCQRRYQQSQREQQQAEAAVTQQTAVWNQQTESLRIHQAEVAQLASKQIELQGISDYLNTLGQLARLRTRKTHCHQAVTSAVEAWQQAQQQEQAAEAHSQRTEMTWHLNQAAELALLLEDQMPCPVCGSCEHPAPAQYAGKVVTKHEVEQARHGFQTAQHARLQAEQQHHDLTQDEANTAEQIDILQQTGSYAAYAHLNEAEAGQRRKQLMAEIQRIQAIDLPSEQAAVQASEQQLQAVTEHCAQVALALDTAYKQWVTAQSEVASFQAQLPADTSAAELAQALTALQAEIQGIEQDAQRLKDQMTKWDKQVSVLRAALTDLTAQITQQQRALAEAEQAWQTVLTASDFATESDYQQASLPKTRQAELEQHIRVFYEQRAGLRAQIETLEQALASVAPPQVAEVQARVSEQKNVVVRLEAAVSACHATTERYVKVQESLNALKQKNVRLSEEYAIYGTLSDVANGKNAQKISLHRFVLGVLLDDVLIQASLRLRKMSKGRYNLLRKIERSKGNGGSGLELLVEDGYTGKTRDVATLSGGESFMAALSLALGLSDVVQSYSGGIRLDTLFIDEGFGSLDAEALDLAMQTLLELQQRGRTIGIISHVSELKEQMSARIDVSTTPSGSDIAVVAG